MVEYLISETEITRRKRAYAAFSLSLVVGIILSSAGLNFPFPWAGYVFIITVLLIIGTYSFRFFRHISQIKIKLANQSLLRIVGNFTEEYLLTKISRVEVKWTANKTIREIYIWLSNDQGVAVTALKHFEQFKKDFVGKLDGRVVAKERHESLNFDHPLFYPTLGLVISFLTILVFKLLVNLNYQQMRIGAFALFAYLSILGIYICIAKPIAKRSGSKTLFSDYLVGGVMVSLGVILLLLLIIHPQGI